MTEKHVTFMTIARYLTFYNYIINDIRDGSKAFDSVNRKVILSVLQPPGFGNPFLFLFN